MRYKNLSYLNRKGPRYIRQRNGSCCGPVCLVNLEKWLGKRATYKDVSDRKKIFENDTTWQIDLLDYLDCLETESTVYIRQAQIRDIDKHLKNKAAILFYSSEQEKSHISLIIGKYRRRYKIINFFAGQTITSMSKKYLTNILKTTSKYSCSQIWAVYKKEEKNIATV